MSKVVATTVLPEDSGEILTIGDAGDIIAISGDSLNLNNLQDAGGNNIITSDGSGNLTVNSGFEVGSGAMKLLTTNTFTDQASSAFTSNIDSTYDVYIWKFNAINPATDDANLTFQVSTDGGSSYGMTATTSYFSAKQTQTGTGQSLAYETSYDAYQSTSYLNLAVGIGNGADECAVGELYIFTPSNTSFVKQWYATVQFYHEAEYTFTGWINGYFNSTSDIDAINFKMNSGNMDGQIKMYAWSKS